MENEINMEVEDCSVNDFPDVEMNELPASSTDEKIDCNSGEQIFFSEQTHLIALLPEILVKIFSYLNAHDLCSVARVCKSWQEVAYYKCLWQNIEARIFLRKDNTLLFDSLTKRGIKKLHVRSIKKKLPELAIVLPNLELLNLSKCSSCIDTTIFKMFAHYAPKLVLLNLSFCDKLSDDSINHIILHCKNINNLQLDCCNSITNHALTLVAEGLKKLKVLSLRAANGISDLGIKNLAGDCSNPSSPAIRSLECLVLEGCVALTNTALQYLSDGFMEQLKTLNLNFCNKVTDDGLRHLTKINSLRELTLRGCMRITGVGFEYLIEDCSSLKELDISFCDKINIVPVTDTSERPDHDELSKRGVGLVFADHQLVPTPGYNEHVFWYYNIMRNPE